MNTSTRRPWLAAVVIALMLLSGIALAVNPNSGTIPSTGQTLNIEITGPSDGGTVPVGDPVTVTGSVGIGGLITNANVLYVVDVSGSTRNPANQDCDGSGDATGDNFNGDGRNGDTLDCEISGVLALNESLEPLTGVDGGVVVFGSTAAVADVSPNAGQQDFTTPLDADVSANGIGDLEDVLRSLVEGRVRLFSDKTVGASTNFNDALTSMNGAFLGQPSTDDNVAFILSDGDGALNTGPGSPLQAAINSGTVVNTYSIGGNAAGCGAGQDLRVIAESTGGTCTEVANPADLAATLGGATPAGIDRVEVSIDGGTPIPASLDVLGNFAATIPGSDITGPSHTIEATVFADDQDVTAVTADVTINVNGAPVSDPNGPYASTGEVTFDGTGSSDPDGDALTFDWDFGDGAGAIDAGPTPSHTYTAEGTYSACLTVSDPGGLSDTACTDVDILTPAPLVDAGPDQSVDEGDTVTLAGTFTDPQTGDTHTATIDWGDGSPTEAGVVDETAGTVTGSHVYPDDGAFTVTAEVCDSDANCADDTLTVTVNNVAPTVDAGPDAAVAVDDTFALSASFTDPGVLDTHTAEIDWGDGSAPEAGTVTEANGSGTVTASHVYTSAGQFTVAVEVCDDDLGCGTDTLTVNVEFPAPLVDAGPDQSVDEGDTVTLAGTFTDPQTGDTHTATIDWGDGSPTEAGVVDETAGTVTGSHVYPDDGAFTVTAEVCDSDANCADDTLTVTVNNVAPTVDAGPDVITVRDAAVTVSGTWIDPAGAADEPYAWSWDLDGDGVFDRTGTGAVGDMAVETTSFTVEGDYTLTFQVVDKDGGVGVDTLVVSVLNQAPVCSEATPTISLLWPPNHDWVSIGILDVNDPDGDPLAVTIDAILQDEPVDTPGSGNTSPDGRGVGTSVAEVRAERAGGENGRVYHIQFSADDGRGGRCSGEVLVGVPKSQGKDGAPIDDGALYDSTAS